MKIIQPIAKTMIILIVSLMCLTLVHAAQHPHTAKLRETPRNFYQKLPISHTIKSLISGSTNLGKQTVSLASALQQKLSIVSSLELPRIPVRQQGDLGTCASCAVCGCYDIYKPRSLASVAEFTIFAESTTDDGIEGINLGNALKVANKNGFVDERRLPYGTYLNKINSYNVRRGVRDDQDKLVCIPGQYDNTMRMMGSPITLKNRKDYKIGLLGSIYPIHHIPRSLIFGIHTNSDIDLTKMAIAMKMPVAAVFPVFDSCWDALNGCIGMPQPGEEDSGYHAVVLTGFDNRRQSFLLRNSWGANWGNGGYAWIPYEYVRLYAAELVAVSKNTEYSPNSRSHDNTKARHIKAGMGNKDGNGIINEPITLTEGILSNGIDSDLGFILGPVMITGGVMQNNETGIVSGNVTMDAASPGEKGTFINSGKIASPIFVINDGAFVNKGGTVTTGTEFALNGGSLQVSANNTSNTLDLTGVTFTNDGTASIITDANTVLRLSSFAMEGIQTTLTKSGSGVLDMRGEMHVAANTVKIEDGSITNGVLTLEGGTIEDISLSEALISSAITFTGTNNIVVNNTSGVLTLSGILGGTGRINIKGPGTLLMSSDNTYTGPTTIASGRLHLGCSLKSPVTVNNGAIFSSDGTVTGLVTNNGTVEPAVRNPSGTFDVGTLIVKGDYTQTGTLNILIGKPNGIWTSSLLDVTGVATLDKESSVNFAPAAGAILDPTDISLIGYTYTFLKAGTGITGFFTKGPLAPSIQNGINFQVAKSAAQASGGGQEAYVILHPMAQATSTSTVTLCTDANTSTTNTLSNQITRAQDKLGPNGGESNSIQSFRASTYVPVQPKSNSLFQNLGHRYRMPQGWDNLFSILDGPLDINQDEKGRLDTTLWVAPVYSQGRNKKTETSLGSTDDMQLLLAGMEWKNSETKHLRGISLGVGSGEAKSSVIASNKSHHKSLQGSLYNSMRWDEVRWDVFLNGNRMFSNNNRVANVSTGYTIKSANVTDTLGAATEVSYRGDLGDLLVVRPYYGIDYWYIIAHGYREKDDSIYTQSHARMASGGFDHYIGASIRKTWIGLDEYSLRVEGDIWYSRTLHDPNLIDTITAVDGSGFIMSRPISGYGRGTLSPSITVSVMNQKTSTKYFVSLAATLQEKRTSYQVLLKAAFPLN